MSREAVNPANIAAKTSFERASSKVAVHPPTSPMADGAHFLSIWWTHKVSVTHFSSNPRNLVLRRVGKGESTREPSRNKHEFHSLSLGRKSNEGTSHKVWFPHLPFCFLPFGKNGIFSVIFI